jgi:antibiotic biosynthesis monooxygenase (ABM) superfamily enzyme
MSVVENMSPAFKQTNPTKTKQSKTQTQAVTKQTSKPKNKSCWKKQTIVWLQVFPLSLGPGFSSQPHAPRNKTRTQNVFTNTLAI